MSLPGGLLPGSRGGGVRRSGRRPSRRGVREVCPLRGPGSRRVAFGGSAFVSGVLPWPRRFLLARARCVLTRHRLQAVFWELRLHTRAYRLPLVVWIRPTVAGERAWVFARAGQCAADFSNAAAEITCACVARDAQVTVSDRFASLVTIDVIRRDVLGPSRVVRSPLADLPDDATGPDRVPAPGAGPEWLAEAGWPAAGKAEEQEPWQ